MLMMQVPVSPYKVTASPINDSSVMMARSATRWRKRAASDYERSDLAPTYSRSECRAGGGGGRGKGGLRGGGARGPPLAGLSRESDPVTMLSQHVTIGPPILSIDVSKHAVVATVTPSDFLSLTVD